MIPSALLTALLAAAVATGGTAEDDARPGPPPAPGPELGAEVAWHVRYTDRERTPSPTILFDRATRAFDVGSYLVPRSADADASTLLSAAIDGRAGRFRLRLAADTGELRAQRFHQLSAVCATDRAPPGGVVTGLDVHASGRCDLDFAGRRTATPPSVQLEDTRIAGARITSNGRPLGDEARTTTFVREGFASVALGPNDAALVAVGRRRFTVADGFVYDDYGTGAQASLDLGAVGPPFALALAAFLPTREFPDDAAVRSPMIALRADFLPSLFEHVGLFAAWFRDRQDSLGGLFRSALVEPDAVRLAGTAPGTPEYAAEARALAATLGREASSEGWLGWLGTSGHVRAPHAVWVDWTAALEAGAVRLTTGSRTVDSTVSGQLGWLRLRGEPARDLEVSVFALYLSGDLPPTERQRLGLPERYGGFLGIAPFVTTTNLFFQGGVSESFSARQATAPGVNGRGVVAPGLGVSWEPGRTVELGAKAAFLSAPQPGPTGGRIYGPELDLDVQWSPVAGVTLLAEGDALWPGDFFAGRGAVTKVVAGVDVAWP